jgi:hypothetical protein
MPIHGTHSQLKTYRLFDNYFSGYIKPNNSKLAVTELEKIIAEKKATLEFVDSIYEETFTARYDDFDDHILETISKYKNNNDEQILYEKSKYIVFETGEYYVETKEGNFRNWIYCIEIDTFINNLKKKIKNLEQKLRKLKK